MKTMLRSKIISWIIKHDNVNSATCYQIQFLAMVSMMRWKRVKNHKFYLYVDSWNKVMGKEEKMEQSGKVEIELKRIPNRMGWSDLKLTIESI